MNVRIAAIVNRCRPWARTGAQRPRNQQGVGLIEVLIAVLVLSIGLLGVGALLATSLSTNNSSMARSMATISSYSILDAMRADLTNAEAGAYNKTVQADSCPAGASSATPAGSALADNQLNAWCAQLADRLGKKSTSGTVDCASDGTCTITITFDDSRSGVAGASSQAIVTKAML